MDGLTAEGRRMIEAAAERHGVRFETAAALAAALAAGYGTQAQFNLAELGGMGQWSQGGMTMVGDMFNTALKARVDALCTDLAAGMRNVQLYVPQAAAAGWPSDLGPASTQGAQNGLRYAVFPATQRLAIARDGQVTIHDTGAHQIGGVSQQQGGGTGLVFTSQFGTFRAEDLPVVGAGAPEEPEAAPARWPESAPVDVQPEAGPVAHWPEAVPDRPVPVAPALPARAGSGDSDVIDMIERLAGLHARGILTDGEYAAKKAELLARL